MAENKSSLAVWEETLANFNTAKYGNGFKVADTFILFLLELLEECKKHNKTMFDNIKTKHLNS